MVISECLLESSHRHSVKGSYEEDLAGLFWTACDHVTDAVQPAPGDGGGRQGATVRARIRGFWWPVAHNAL